MRLLICRLSVLCVFVLFSVSLAQAANLAIVNSEAITTDDLEAALGNFTKAQKHNILKDENSKNFVVQNLIDQEVLYQQAKRQGLNKTSDYQQAVRAFEKQALSRMILDKLISPKMTDSALNSHYASNKAFYTTTQVHAQHILLETDSEARRVMALAKAKSDRFQELALQHSKDPTVKSNQGDLGYFFRNQMTPEFSDVAFRTKKGEITGPIKTQHGFHVIKVIDRIAGRQLSYEEVADQVRASLQQKLAKDLVRQLRKSSKIQYVK